MTEQEADKAQYYEVDIEYTTGAKMVLLAETEDAIRELLVREFSDIPDMRVTNIALADPELIAEAKARRAYTDQLSQTEKNQIN